MKSFPLLVVVVTAVLSGCATSREIVSIPHADGSGFTRYKYIAAGGIIRPGVIVLVQETVGSNAPNVLTHASGTPLAPAVFGVAGNIGTALALGTTWPDNDENISTTTVFPAPGSPVLPNPPPAGPRFPPGPPPGHPNAPSRPPHRAPNHK